jgi:hypothetical protein
MQSMVDHISQNLLERVEDILQLKPSDVLAIGLEGECAHANEILLKIMLHLEVTNIFS